MKRKRSLVQVECDGCGKPMWKRREEIKRTRHNFHDAACHGVFITRSSNERRRAGFTIGDDVIRKFSKRGKVVLGIVNGFGRRLEYFRVIIGANRFAKKQSMRAWMLLVEADLVAAKELKATDYTPYRTGEKK